MSMTITTGDDRDDDTIDLPDDIDDDRDVSDDVDEDDDARQNDRKSRRTSQDDDEDDPDVDEDDPEILKATIKRLRASLAKSNSTGLRRRNQLKELRKATAVLADNDDPDDEDGDDEESEEKPKQQRSALDARAVQKRIERARKEERRKAEEEHSRDLIDTRAESALSKAGADDKAIRLLKRELDYDDLELLKDRTVDGLDEEIDRLKSEFPNLFRGNKAARRRINGGDDRDAPRSKRALSTNERQALILKGRG